jgi:hypothetical protein
MVGRGTGMMMKSRILNRERKKSLAEIWTLTFDPLPFWERGRRADAAGAFY